MQAGESLTSHMLHSSPRIKVPSIASSANIVSQQQVPTSREERLLESSPGVKKNQSQSISTLPLKANRGSTVPVSSSVNPAISTKQWNLSTNEGDHVHVAINICVAKSLFADLCKDCNVFNEGVEIDHVHVAINNIRVAKSLFADLCKYCNVFTICTKVEMPYCISG